MTTRRTERDVTYNEPYRRTGPAPAEVSRPAAPMADRDMRAESETRTQPQAAAGIAGERMSFTDRVNGGPVWSGFIIGIAAWILFEVILLAAGLNHIRSEGTSAPRSELWWSFGAGVVALFIGGLVAGLASRWHTMGAAALQGLTIWALTTVALLLLGLVGGGIAFGAFSETVSVRPGTNISPSAINTAQDAATGAIVLLAVTAVVAVLGAILGAWLSGRRPGRPQTPARGAAGRA